ncbi:MAG: Cof-type HAD-IIB family hydrolase [Coprobacter sp.]|nr:Cof-type HAD-IIB family hydrolase [Coprobacter sp.]
MTKALFFDIDGTLVSFRTHEIIPSAYDAIALLRSKGVKVFIATGRPLHLIRGLRDAQFDGYITFNGSYCITADGNEIYCNTIPRDELQQLIAHEQQHGPYSYAFMTLGKVYTNRITDRVEEVARLLALPVPTEADMHRVAEQEKVIQINLYTDEADEYPVMETIPHCLSSRWSPLFTDINLRGDSKQSGIDKVLEYYGIDLADTMAFGDGGNDISMLRHVAIGVAMGNAYDSVKAHADYITDTVDNDGIAKALTHFGLI